MAVLSFPGSAAGKTAVSVAGTKRLVLSDLCTFSILSRRQRPPFMASSGLLGLWQPERVVAGASAGGDVSALESETAEASLERRWT